MGLIFGPGADAKLRARIGEDLYARQHANRHLCVPVDKNGYFASFHVSDLRDAGKRDARVLVYLGKEELILAAEKDGINALLRDIKRDESPVLAFVEFLTALTADDIDQLERVERDINDLDDGIVMTKRPMRNVGMRIIALRRELLTYKRYYEQLDVVLDSLAEDELTIYSKEETDKLAAIERRVRRLLESVSHLREGVTQAREAYQAQIDIEQNQIMKIFTVITAIFLPLTLIVGWYGMNFDMPEYHWAGGYPFVIALSAVVCVGLFVMFKQKKWF
jgi:magnesium transporter